MDPIQNTVTSKDGTTIAYEQSGKGPVVILVASALSDRSDTKRLAKQLATQFTVINYDRRGRSQSSDAKAYAPEREIEDIEALVNQAGGTASLFGSSSGAVLALDAANKLGGKILKLALYEPPLIVDNSRPAVDGTLAGKITQLATDGHGSVAVKLFFTKALGIPPIGVFFMRFMPGWSKMCGMAHTAAYDLAILNGLQVGKPLPSTRWSRVTVPTFVMTGEKSEPFFHSGAKALAELLPNARHQVMKGQHHGSVVMAPKAFADAIITFVKS